MESNLDCFLHCTTPVTEIRNLNRLWHPWEREKVEYFTLSDLWKCFDEWSAYGAKVPITLHNGETLTQYYVPYLSAIQIFTGLREETESGDGDTRDSSSDCCSEESDSDKLWRWEGSGSTSSEDGGSEQEAFLHLNDRLGYLYFQFFEKSTPYGRVPLLDKCGSVASKLDGCVMVPNLSYSYGKNYQGLVHLFPHLSYSIIFISRYGYGGGGGRNEDATKERSRGRDTGDSVWGGDVQDAREPVGGGQRWSRSREANVAVERGRVMVKAIEGPTP
ncbi:DUF789 domain-containing protein [Cucumis melo var. makuwa]|uniref:DUF789 domain-containing protein n=1 Tax=Cucumis melo var. makuwa TaxID=1194695 RepID=A0A5D3C9P7_CUCMM|nr:DUF789 domain-containing protein [Cucumis melo var. makuwa]